MQHANIPLKALLLTKRKEWSKAHHRLVDRTEVGADLCMDFYTEIMHNVPDLQCFIMNSNIPNNDDSMCDTEQS